MGHDSEGSIKDRSNGAGPGRNVQYGGSFGVTLCKRELGGDRVDAQGPDGVLPSDGATDHGDGGKTWGRRRVVVSSGKVGDGLRGAPPRWSIHEETLDKHIGEGGLLAHL